tara:strand:+ start:1299 stop:1856 length:558 start_codon:yes stop_codon:yes gene_type:complete
MTNNQVLEKLYKSHKTWVLMADKMLPAYKLVPAEDVVQTMYIKIYEKLNKNKLKTADIIIKGKPHYGIIYMTLRDIVGMIYRDKSNYITSNTTKDTDYVSTQSGEFFEYSTNKFIYEEQESAAEFYEKIDNIINGFDWFHKKLFKLYTKKFQSIRDLSKATTISYMTVWKHINACKKEIKNKMKK